MHRVVTSTQNYSRRGRAATATSWLFIAGALSGVPSAAWVWIEHIVDAMSGVFQAHPWDKEDRVKGASVFDRKLLYGKDHDRVEHLDDEGSKATYGKAERHKMHDFWRSNALKLLAETVRRSGGKEATLRKVQGKRAKEWPGDLGKHHAIMEEMLTLGVVTLHQDKDAEVFARILPAKLAEAQQKFSAAANDASASAAAAAAASTASSIAPSASVEPFVPSASFAGARPGYVFKRGESGVGYYLDGAAISGSGSGGGSGGASSSAGLPAGWVAGQTPEGYTYYWHDATQTSSWEVPTGEPKSSRSVPLEPLTTHALTSDGGAAVGKIESDSGAVVSVDARSGTARVVGTAQQVARACQLIERKAGAVAFAARAGAQQQQPPQQPAVGHKRSHPSSTVSSYNFTGLQGFVQQADEAREVLRQKGAESGTGALAALAGAYGDTDDEGDEES